MARSTVYMVSDDSEVIEKAKAYFGTQNVNLQVFTPNQWREGMENPGFRSQMLTGIPALMTGFNPLHQIHRIQVETITMILEYRQ